MQKEKYKIIIVDDNQSFIDAMKFLFLKRNDIEVVGEANDAKGFLKILKIEQPDIVLMDMILPGISGLIAADMAITIGHDIKFVGVTMSDDSSIHSDMKNHGFVAGILKNQFFDDFENTMARIKNGEKYFPVLSHI
ncbi:MAG: response regulator transcription factor [Prolixibacteraceae bacterium]|nr:response regulator transcription factor [Prolixibacteraceae bacterium]